MYMIIIYIYIISLDDFEHSTAHVEPLESKLIFEFH